MFINTKFSIIINALHARYITITNNLIIRILTTYTLYSIKRIPKFVKYQNNNI